MSFHQSHGSNNIFSPFCLFLNILSKFPPPAISSPLYSISCAPREDFSPVSSLTSLILFPHSFIPSPSLSVTHITTNPFTCPSGSAHHQLSVFFLPLSLPVSSSQHLSSPIQPMPLPSPPLVPTVSIPSLVTSKLYRAISSQLLQSSLSQPPYTPFSFPLLSPPLLLSPQQRLVAINQVVLYSPSRQHWPGRAVSTGNRCEPSRGEPKPRRREV